MDPLFPEDQAPKPDFESRGVESDATRPQDLNPHAIQVAAGFLQLKQRFHSGAAQFSIIAAFSLVNTLLIYSGSSVTFVGVLGVVKIVNFITAALVPQFGASMYAVGLTLSLVATGVFFLLGNLSKRHKGWAFSVGMALYLLDAGICAYFGLWIEVAFHLYLMTLIYDGLAAHKEILELEEFGRAAGQKPA